MQQRGLGRGLGALMPEREDPPVRWVRADEVLPNPFQPRRHFDAESMAGLVESIKDRGLMQPLVVRRVESGYEIIAGERRLRAAREAGMQQIPVIIRESDGQQSLEMSIIENVQREDLNPVEEALAYRRLAQEFHLTQEEIAAKVRKDRSTVANLLRLLALPDTILGHVQNGSLTVGHARALLSLDDTAAQSNLAQEIVRKSLSVREAERLVRSTMEGSAEKEPAGRSSPFLNEVIARLQRMFSTKVRVRGNEDGKGKIEIDYYSRTDLERILSVLNRDG